MPRDNRSFITVHDGMPHHRKIRPLSDRAFRAIIEIWCWASENRTDGVIDADNFATFGDKKARDQLLARGLIERAGDGFFAHDYLQHQRSKAEIAALSEQKRAAGAKGGRAKADALADAKQRNSGTQPESENRRKDQDSIDRPNLSNASTGDDLHLNPELKSILVGVREHLGIDLHPLGAAVIQEFLDTRRGPKAKPLQAPHRYYPKAIAGSPHEVAKYIHDNQLAREEA